MNQVSSDRIFCNDCKYAAYSGNHYVCGYYLHGGETVYIDEDVALWCPLKEKLKGG